MGLYRAKIVSAGIDTGRRIAYVGGQLGVLHATQDHFKKTVPFNGKAPVPDPWDGNGSLGLVFEHP